VNSALPTLIDISGIPEEHRWNPKPRAETWGTAIGAWGDCLIDLGIAKAFLGEGFGIINFSKDPDIAKFIEAQPFVRECIRVEPKNAKDYHLRYWEMVSTPQFGQLDGIYKIVRRSGIHRKNVVCTSIDNSKIHRRIAYPWHGAVLPSSAYSDAMDMLRRETDPLIFTKPFYIINPYSLNSCPLEEQWSHWDEAIELLLRYTPYTYILVGTGYNIEGRHDRLVNLVGQTDSMLEVMALAQMSQGVFTTANGLSHWCWVQNIPSVVVGNKPLSSYESYFKHYLNKSDNLVMFENGLAEFWQFACRMLK
jgi:hypothetical protein